MADMEFYIKRSLCNCEVRTQVFFSFEEVIADAERAYWDIFIASEDIDNPLDENRVFTGLNDINEQFCDLFRYIRVTFSHCANYWIVFEENGIDHSYKFADKDLLIYLLKQLDIEEPDFVANRLLVKIGE